MYLNPDFKNKKIYKNYTGKGNKQLDASYLQYFFMKRKSYNVVINKSIATFIDSPNYDPILLQFHYIGKIIKLLLLMCHKFTCLALSYFKTKCHNQ